ncbi:drug/metabolite exporter YedA [Thermovenabulum sp.]|uniref:drug/metabolite exporter YedA n=1 Tax=Thermovenabulum sp. TaxID=3100335 RepID=UPI003C7E63E1
MDNPVIKTNEVLSNRKKFQVLIALFSVYLFWGGTYLGIKFAIETIPPFIMAGTRFLLAGLILYFWSLLSGYNNPTRKQWFSAGIIGTQLLFFGNGFVVLAEQLVPSGIAATIIATVPLWIILLEWLWKKQKSPNKGVILGIILGFAGILILVTNSSGTPDKNNINPLGVALLLFASFSWSLGSLSSRTVDQPRSPLLFTAMQMIVGGILLFLASILKGEWAHFNIFDLSFRSFLSLLYLIIFGSIVAYNAYIWLLKNADSALVSTYAFVNPIVAVFIGWLIAGEQLTVNTLIATIIIILSVIIITIFRNRN